MSGLEGKSLNMVDIVLLGCLGFLLDDGRVVAEGDGTVVSVELSDREFSVLGELAANIEF